MKVQEQTNYLPYKILFINSVDIHGKSFTYSQEVKNGKKVTNLEYYKYQLTQLNLLTNKLN